MGAARPPCAGGPYRTARSQAADGHDHALTDGQRKRAARTLTGGMVLRSDERTSYPPFAEAKRENVYSFPVCKRFNA